MREKVSSCKVFWWGEEIFIARTFQHPTSWTDCEVDEMGFKRKINCKLNFGTFNKSFVKLFIFFPPPAFVKKAEKFYATSTFAFGFLCFILRLNEYKHLHKSPGRIAMSKGNRKEGKLLIHIVFFFLIHSIISYRRRMRRGLTRKKKLTICAHRWMIVDIIFFAYESRRACSLCTFHRYTKSGRWRAKNKFHEKAFFMEFFY